MKNEMSQGTRDKLAYINAQEPGFLRQARKKGYICPVCGNGSGHNGTGICQNPRSKKWHCFKCGFDGDVLDLYCAQFHPRGSFRKQLDEAASYFGMTQEVCTHVPQQSAPDTRMEEPADYSVFYQEAACRNNGKYLLGRGISLETQKRFEIGYVPNWKSSRAIQTITARGLDAGSIPASPRCIIPRTKSCYLARDVRTDLTESQKRFEKQIEGRLTEPFNADTLRTPGVVFVTEGEIDALSLEEVGVRCAALCSASNTKLFLDYVQLLGSPHAFVIMMDNDEAGERATELLRDGFSRLGMPSIIAGYPDGIKDPNQYLCERRSELTTLARGTERLAMKLYLQVYAGRDQERKSLEPRSLREQRRAPGQDPSL